MKGKHLRLGHIYCDRLTGQQMVYVGRLKYPKKDYCFTHNYTVELLDDEQIDHLRSIGHDEVCYLGPFGQIIENR